MYILGISGYDEHTSAASVIKDGKILCCAYEERFSRIKYDNSFPGRSILSCLESCNLSLSDLDCFTYFKNPWLKLRYAPQYIMENFPESITSIQFKRLSILGNTFSVKKKLQQIFQTAKIPQIHYVDHHLGHAAVSFYNSGFSESAILSVDFAGEITSCWLGYAKGKRIFRIAEILFPDSPGFLYAAITEHLGYKMLADEGKIMGLAPYGKSTLSKEFQKVFSLGRKPVLKINREYLNISYAKRDVLTKSLNMLSDKFILMLPPVSRNTKEPCNAMKDIAYCLQEASEKILLHIAQILYEHTGLSNICYAGGFALNSVANGKLLSDGPFRKIYIFPAADDAGTAPGSALYYYYNGDFR